MSFIVNNKKVSSILKNKINIDWQFIILYNYYIFFMVIRIWLHLEILNLEENYNRQRLNILQKKGKPRTHGEFYYSYSEFYYIEN